ncbi:hypothetical protein SDC9_158579 [bioreactor metagenome]|uniref:Uncharacterized protein n=1 Tax=bioreactor metagenome TaxID=1076179 RepID=A0A645FA82_9ZZZZ
MVLDLLAKWNVLFLELDIFTSNCITFPSFFLNKTIIFLVLSILYHLNIIYANIYIIFPNYEVI